MSDQLSFADAMLSVSQIFLFVLFMAGAVERVMEFLIKPLVKRISASWAPTLSPYLAGAMGITLAIFFGADLISPMAEGIGLAVMSKWPGLVVTGIFIGGGSNGLHDFWSKYLTKKPE